MLCDGGHLQSDHQTVFWRHWTYQARRCPRYPLDGNETYVEEEHLGRHEGHDWNGPGGARVDRHKVLLQWLEVADTALANQQLRENGGVVVRTVLGVDPIFHPTGWANPWPF